MRGVVQSESLNVYGDDRLKKNAFASLTDSRSGWESTLAFDTEAMQECSPRHSSIGLRERPHSLGVTRLRFQYNSVIP